MSDLAGNERVYRIFNLVKYATRSIVWVEDNKGDNICFAAIPRLRYVRGRDFAFFSKIETLCYLSWPVALPNYLGMGGGRDLLDTGHLKCYQNEILVEAICS